MAIKLNHMKLDIGVIMQKLFLRTFDQWLFFLTESGRILEGDLLKISPSEGRLIREEGLFEGGGGGGGNRVITVSTIFPPARINSVLARIKWFSFMAQQPTDKLSILRR